MRGDAVDPRVRRSVIGKTPRELRDLLGIALDFDRHARTVVVDPAREVELVREPEDERPVAHALHDAAHFDAPAHRRGRMQGRFHR